MLDLLLLLLNSLTKILLDCSNILEIKLKVLHGGLFSRFIIFTEGTFPEADYPVLEVAEDPLFADRMDAHAHNFSSSLSNALHMVSIHSLSFGSRKRKALPSPRLS